MKAWICSRTKNEDYIWRSDDGYDSSALPTALQDGFDKWNFEDNVPWYGFVSKDHSTTLYFGNLPTNRLDSRGRRIFIHAVLRGDGHDDARMLCDWMSELLVDESAAISRWAGAFLETFDGKQMQGFSLAEAVPVSGVSDPDIGRYVYPKSDAASRAKIADQVRSTMEIGNAVAVGVTGRSGKGIFERVCCSNKEWQVAFFSSGCTMKTELATVRHLPAGGGGGDPFANRRHPPLKAAIIIGGVILIIILTCLMRSCRKNLLQEQDNLPKPPATRLSNAPGRLQTESMQSLSNIVNRANEMNGAVLNQDKR